MQSQLKGETTEIVVMCMRINKADNHSSGTTAKVKFEKEEKPTIRAVTFTEDRMFDNDTKAVYTVMVPKKLIFTLLEKIRQKK